MDSYHTFIKTANAPYEYQIIDDVPKLVTSWMTNSEFVEQMKARGVRGTDREIVDFRFHSNPCVSGEFLLYLVDNQRLNSIQEIQKSLDKLPLLESLIALMRTLHFDRPTKSILHSDSTEGFKKRQSLIDTVSVGDRYKR